MLPRARVVYCSATGVSEVGNMAYMTRLGLWGSGRPCISVMNHRLSVVKNFVHLSKSMLLTLIEHRTQQHLIYTQRDSSILCLGPSYGVFFLCKLLPLHAGSAFPDFEQFLDSMKKRGVSFMEMLAMELKAEGNYVARGLSFKLVTPF